MDPGAAALDHARQEGITAVASHDELLRALEPPRVIWAMIPAGPPVDALLDALMPKLARGDLVVDGGNSNWRDSKRRGERLGQAGFEFSDAGTSGGVWGLELGYCLMVGGSDAAIARLKPALDTLAPPNGWRHMGPVGSGHFVKMVHNGIEYGLMQAYAEGFDILKNAGQQTLPAEHRFTFDIADIAEVWRRGSVIPSWLLDLTASALARDAKLDAYSGFVEDSGEGRWTINAAIDEAVPAEVLTAALFARFRSRQEHTFAEKILSAMRAGFGGHREPHPPSHGGPKADR